MEKSRRNKSGRTKFDQINKNIQRNENSARIIEVHAWNKETGTKNPRRIAIIVCVEAPLSEDERERERDRGRDR